jgi:hypothetical protein
MLQTDVSPAAIVKDEGNDLFRQKDYKGALKLYLRAVDMFGEQSTEAMTTYKNIAACHLKLVRQLLPYPWYSTGL